LRANSFAVSLAACICFVSVRANAVALVHPLYTRHAIPALLD